MASPELKFEVVEAARFDMQGKLDAFLVAHPVARVAQIELSHVGGGGRRMMVVILYAE